MATLSVGYFVPIPGQTVYLTDKASNRIGMRPIRLLVTEESKPYAVEGCHGSSDTRDWITVTGYELGPCSERVRLHRCLLVYRPAVMVWGNPGITKTL